MTNSAIRVEGISKRYPGQKEKLALDKIRFNVPPGQPIWHHRAGWGGGKDHAFTDPKQCHASKQW